MNKILKILGAAALLALFSVSAHATLITASSNNPLAFSWSYFDGTDTLAGSGTLAVSGFNSSSLTVAISLTNNATVSSDRLTMFGFGIDPNATGVSFSDPGDSTGMTDAAFKGNGGGAALALIDVCAMSGSNCQGGSNDGIFGAGGSDAFSIILAGIWGSTVDINPLGFKYQTSHSSSEFTLTPPGTPPSPPETVPEPNSLALLGMGLIASAFSLRRRSGKVW